MGVKSEREGEQLRKDLDVAKAELLAVKLDVDAANEEWEAKKNEQIQKEREAQTKVDYSLAMQQDALGQMAVAQKEKIEALPYLLAVFPRIHGAFMTCTAMYGSGARTGITFLTIIHPTM